MMQVIDDIKGFIITSEKEKERAENVAYILAQLPQVEIMPAIYPGDTRIPFLQRLVNFSELRTGTALNYGEIGVLLSNRRIWRAICKRAVDDKESYLVLESDSIIADGEMLGAYYEKSKSYDLFFWGAWSGNMQIHRSTICQVQNGYTIGEPYIRTIYGAYGYSLNRKAARLLLQRTAKVGYPIDQYKRYFKRQELSIGGVVPEVITHLDGNSTIGHTGVVFWRRKMFLKYLWVRNRLICFFS